MPELNLEAARKMVDAAFDYAREHNWKLSIAVLDAGGHILQISRMDNCNFLAPEIARGKAYAAAAWKQPSAELATRWNNGAMQASGMVAASGQRIVPVQGGLPIFDGDRCVGAIGGSGARGNEDEDAARAGLKAAGFSEAPAG